MRDQRVHETLSSKCQQFILATQVVKMILKIDGAFVCVHSMAELQLTSSHQIDVITSQGGSSE
jgi:hypothetical protein